MPKWTNKELQHECVNMCTRERYSQKFSTSYIIEFYFFEQAYEAWTLVTNKFIIKGREDHCQVDSLYLDIRKAFDTIPHNKLLTKVWSIGVINNLWLFFKAYLTNRRQCVEIEGHQSKWLPVTFIVPQGSILGPFLFIICINKVPSMLSFSSALLYADDTKCFKHLLSSADCSLLQTDLDQLLSGLK